MFGNEEKKQPIVPVEFTEKVQVNPISFMDQNINTSTNYAILKTTANGKYVRGNMLYFKIGGVEIYTDINNIIFVDSENHTLFIREYEKVFKEILPDDPDKKEYIILYTDLGYEEGSDSSEFPLRWECIQGRMNAYESIITNAPVIDIDKSLVLVDNVKLSESLSVRQFVEYLKNANIVEDDFDISIYGSQYN